MNRKELPIPDAAADDPICPEILRVWIGTQEYLVSSRTTHFEDPAVWGEVLADVAYYLAREYAKRSSKRGRMTADIADLLARIRVGLDENWGVKP
jgi:hypothetical protein